MEENEWLLEGIQRLFHNSISRWRAQKRVTQLAVGASIPSGISSLNPCQLS